jgi:hypothetical protein
MTTDRKLYQSVDILNTFIGEIAVEHDSELLKIKAYGDPEQIKKDKGKCYEPLFYSNDVHEYLFSTVKNAERYFKDYDDTEKHNDVWVHLSQTNKQGTVYSKSQSCRMLTKFGLYRAFISVPKKAGALVFKQFVWLVMDKLERDRTVEFMQVKEDLDAEHERVGALERVNFEQSHEIKNHADIEDIFENAELQGKNEQKMFHLMQKKFLKPISIYVVSTEFMTTKKANKRRNPKKGKKSKIPPVKKGKAGFELFGLSESDDDNSNDEKSDDTDGLEYDYHRCNKYNLEADPNAEYYFFIPIWPAKAINQSQTKRGIFKYAFDIHIENRDHYTYMLDLITNKDSATDVSGVLKTTYSSIREYSQCAFINLMLREIRKHTNDEKTTKQSQELDILAQNVQGYQVLPDVKSLRFKYKTIDNENRLSKKKRITNGDSSGSDVEGYNDNR